MVNRLLDISIGPVQGFVRQSRRSRDLWGSSYLLSFLAAHAMAGAADAGGTLAVVEDPMLKAVRATRAGAKLTDPPRIGTTPNHFQVVVDGDPATVAAAAERALREAWQRVCDVVRERFLVPVLGHGEATDEIWRRQVASFWQTTWVAGADERGGGALLARRKHWRSHCPPEEPGDKCTVMHTLQELSGHIRASGRGAGRQDKFWAELRSLPGVGMLDLREDERLCAVALVKRLFPAQSDVAGAALGWPMTIGHWPSTVWIGALPWLPAVQEAAPEAADRYAGEVRRYADGAVRDLDGPVAALAPPGDLSRLDANYLHVGFVADRRLCPLPRAADQETEARGMIERQLRQLYAVEAAGGERKHQVGAPPVYYALLQADGDHLGEVAAAHGREPVGRALADFAFGSDGQTDVKAIVQRHCGLTVYAGGDDVLAMLPARDALQCAEVLAERYEDVFRRRLPPTDKPVTLSAAVLFAHVRMPLVVVLAEAKRLLEEEAKERNDRDSVAVGVLKPGGMHCEWVTHWQRTGSDGRTGSAVRQLRRLVDRLRGSGPEPGFSSSLLYRVRDTLSLLCGGPHWRPGEPQTLPSDVDATAYLRAEVHHSLAAHTRSRGEADGDDDWVRREAGELTELVWSLLRHTACEHPSDSSTPPQAAGARVSLDPLLLARFLAHEGREEEHL